MNKRGRWHIGAVASAIALLGSLASLEAHALALGRITVQSALGEPLRAEIDIADITPAEASSLKAGVASSDTFKAAGLEYNSAITGLEVNLQRRADGRAFLRLSSNRAVTEPFVDLILEATWANGRITRDYTMLFDPPTLRSGGTGAAIAPTAPSLPRPAASTPPAKGIASIPYAPPAPAAPTARPAPVAKAPVAEKSTPTGDKQVTVKAGDTAGKIAAQNKSASVSLDQMLVAMLRSNPDAFIGGNINRIKSGAVLDMPTNEAASAISAGEASQTIVAQSKDFNSFRRKLADAVPATQVTGADRQAAGKVQAKVEDRAPASSTPDKLTLSKGAVQGKAAATAAEEKIAKERQAKDASVRVAELTKNISDLNKLGSAPTAAPGAAAAPAAAKAPGVAVTAPVSVMPAPVPAPAPVVVSAPAPAAVAVPAAVPVVAAASAPVAVASQAASPALAASESAAPVVAAASEAQAAAPAPKPVVKKPVPPPAPEPSLVDELLGNPLLLPLGGGLILLLAGFGFYRYRRNAKGAQIDSSFLESRLQPDSFFGASGGQRIDTNEGNVTGSSLVYSPSQLDAAGDVDPVAEADVYLAYGRDLQAEEILKEAIRTSPTRVAIHAKLLEIYAKRRDSSAFEGIAAEAFSLTHGTGPEWEYIAEMGRELDPGNSTYQAGGQAGNTPRATVQSEPAAAFNPASTATHVPPPVQAVRQPAPVPAAMPEAAGATDIDFDLDFSLDDEPVAPPAPLPLAATQTMASLSMPDLNGLDMDFGGATIAISPPPSAKPVAAAKPAAVQSAPAPVADNGMLEFDLDSLSLDLDTKAPSQSPAVAEGPLDTKFQLAEEFRSLGDTDGARSLAQEVLAEASGPLKAKAQAFLNGLS